MNSPLMNYESLVEFLKNKENATNIGAGMKLDFSLYYLVMGILIKKQPFHEPVHIVKVTKYLQRMADGKGNNLAINMPPGYGKTNIIVYWIAWCLTRSPNVQFLYTNCVFTSVKQRGSEILAIIKSKWTRILFEVEPSREAYSNTLFRLKGADSRSGFVGVAYEGGATGLDAGNPNVVNDDPIFTWDDIETQEIGNSDPILTFGGGLIIDDALNSSFIRSEARKETMRDIYKNTLSSRIRGKNCKKIVLAQRLCIDDIFAVIKEYEKDGIEKWDWCIIPALDENNRSTCEWAKSTEMLLAMRESYSLREQFWAQYQQQPIVPTGEIIKAEWFKEYDGNLYNMLMLNMFITADTAVGKSNSGDWTVFCLWCTTAQGLFLIDMIRGKWDLPAQIQKAIAFWNQWHDEYDKFGNKIKKHATIHGLNDAPSTFYIEEANHGVDLMRMLKNAGGSGSFIPVKELKPYKDKVTRIQDHTPWIEAGYVFLPKNRPDIVKAVLDECIKFTYTDEHEHDDIVDCLAYAIQVGLSQHQAIYPTVKDLFKR